jgi:transcription regulator MmyB-like protein
MLHLIFDPNGMRPFVANWEDAAGGLFERAYREAIGRIVDEKTKELLAALLSCPDVRSGWKNPIPLGFMSVIPLSFVKDDRVLNYFSMLTTVGTPQTIAAQELRIECPFPADEAAATLHVALMSAA